MASFAESAAQLVALLNKIDTTEKDRHWKAGTVPQMFKFSPQGQISYVSKDEIDMEVNRNLREVRAIQHKLDSMRVELGELATLLAAPAHDRGVNWIPVLRLFNTWELSSDDLVTAKTQAMMLQSILPVEVPDEVAEKPVPGYVQFAYLSFTRAIQENPRLQGRSLREVYAWIKEHGVEIDGKPYDPPGCETWIRYRRTGERAAQRGNI